MKLEVEQLQEFAAGVDRVEPLPQGGVALHRLPQKLKALYTANDAQRARAECTAGVRLRFVSDTKWIRVALRYGEPARWYFLCALTVDGERMDAFGAVSRQETWEGFAFTQEKRERHLFEIWLPHLCAAEILSLEVEDGCVLEAAPPLAFKWLAWGDSITHGMNASLPIFTWPAQVARKLNANVINYGVGGATLQKELAGCVDALVSRRDGRGAVHGDREAEHDEGRRGRRPSHDSQSISADSEVQLITVSYGANDWNIAVPLAEFRANAVALVSALRKRFLNVPIILTTPVPFFRATKPNKNSETLDDFRAALESAAREHKVHIIHGTDLVAADHNYFNDWSHPNDAGMNEIATNMLTKLKTLGIGGK
jgi:lysophospholipase L1-like esterase